MGNLLDSENRGGDVSTVGSLRVPVADDGCEQEESLDDELATFRPNRRMRLDTRESLDGGLVSFQLSGRSRFDTPEFWPDGLASWSMQSWSTDFGTNSSPLGTGSIMSLGCSSAQFSDFTTDAEQKGQPTRPVSSGCSSSQLSDFATDADQKEMPKAKRESGRTRQRRAQAKIKQVDMETSVRLGRRGCVQ